MQEHHLRALMRELLHPAEVTVKVIGDWGEIEGLIKEIEACKLMVEYYGN
jgi:hypothetical protein